MLYRASMLSSMLACVLAAAAYGHPGHATEVGDSHTISHYVLHPDHLMVWIVAAVAIIGGLRIIQVALRRPAPAYARARKHR